MTSQNTPTRISRASVALAVGLLAFGTVACGDDSSDSADTAADTAAAATTVAIGSAAPAIDVVVDGQWARTSPADAVNGAAYFTITSADADKLIGVMADASVAGMTQMHETVMKDATDTSAAMGTETTAAMGSGTTVAGMGEMTMQPVDFIDLPAGTAVELKPGGYHIMMMDLVAPLKVGDTIQLTLTLEKAGEITIDVPVLDEAP
jgi:copper(I)-binding protein